MALTATPSRRRWVMIALLLLAAAGGVIRASAPDPSTWRDIGTLLLVLWLPAVGNLVAYFLKKVPGRARPAMRFAPGSAFAPQLQVRLQWTPLAEDLRAGFDPAATQCTVLVGRSGFTARLGEPIGPVLAGSSPRTLPLECLHPVVALRSLVPGTEFHLLAGTTAVAQGTVLR